ncbi:hypothetical protein [Nonomuraea ceibae]|uniref:hypothetical protein n=1 Tax=Nonomuraea ceibae TaxID=1935170 RepID=UPI001C5D60BB|nr:hypothetical protein [Nonomuraea ceibae]
MPDTRVHRDEWIIWPIASESRQVVELPSDFYLQELMELPPWELEAAAIPDFYEKVDGVPHGGVHRGLVDLHVTTAQEAITTWLALQRPDGLDALVDQEATEEEVARFNAVPGNAPLSLEEFRRLCLESRPADLRSIVDGALSKFSIGLRGLSDRWPTVYSVSFLQLYNHLVEKTEFRQCANEPCGKTFVRQRGRAEFGQHRT